MPVSVVCETTANVNAALLESLGGGGCSAAASIDDATKAIGALSSASASVAAEETININSNEDEDDDETPVESLQSKLVASAKRALLTKIDYEEVSNYSDSVLDALKSKYIVLKPNSADVQNGIANGGELTNGNGHHSPNNNDCADDSEYIEDDSDIYTQTDANAENGCTSASASTCKSNGNNNNNGTAGCNGISVNNHNGFGLNGNAIDASAQSSRRLTYHNTANGDGVGPNARFVITDNAVSAVRNGDGSDNISANSHSTTIATPIPTASVAPTTTTRAAENSNGANSSVPLKRERGVNQQHELPEPKYVLFPRECVLIGWKNPTRKWQVGVGMMNVGNTCYLNSTLQALFHVPAFANWLAADAVHHSERCEAADTSCIICAMSKTLLASQTNQSAIRPFCVYSKLKMICKHLVMGRQEDAHEFLRYLVDAMERSYLARFRNHKDLDQYSKETTPLNQILGGYLKSSVRCLACGYVSVTFQHFEDLLLDIRKADTLDEALDGYFSRERLEDMGYRCESCKKKVTATKQFSLERAPIVLCIQLKRFSIVGTKLNKQIPLKARLDLTRFVSQKTPGEPLTYRLVSLVTHLGASQHCGHYTAIGLTESGTYYNFDDSYVRPISVQNVCSTNAYIMFYEVDTAPMAMRLSMGGTFGVDPQHSNVNVNNSSECKENNYAKTNGYVSAAPLVSNESNNVSVGPHRMIGPQLPPGATKCSNGSGSGGNVGGNGVLHASNLGNNLSTHKEQHVLSASSAANNSNNINNNSNYANINNSKITIHFKNGAANSPAAANASASASVTPTCSYQHAIAGKTQFGNNNNNTTLNLKSNSSKSTCADGLPGRTTVPLQNGPLSLAGTNNTFQESLRAKPALTDTPDKVHAVAVSGGDIDSGTVNSVSLSQLSSSHQNKLSAASTSDSNSNVATSNVSLPSMPALIESASVQSSSGVSAEHHMSNGVSGVKQEIAEVVIDKKNVAYKCNSSLSLTAGVSSSKSLVPYETESEEEATALLAGSKRIKRVNEGQQLKRPNSAMACLIMARDGNIGEDDSTQSETKQKTDIINEIFKLKKSNVINDNSSNKHTNNPQILEALAVSVDAEALAEQEHTSNNNGATRVPFKRAHSTPPTTASVKSPTGVWQVTSLNSIGTSVSPSNSKLSRNPKNPFAIATPSIDCELFSKRQKLHSTAASISTAIVKMAPERNSGVEIVEDAAPEALQQSHRGYGATVLTWNEGQPNLQLENISVVNVNNIGEQTRKQKDADKEDNNDGDNANHGGEEAGKVVVVDISNASKNVDNTAKGNNMVYYNTSNNTNNTTTTTTIDAASVDSATAAVFDETTASNVISIISTTATNGVTPKPLAITTTKIDEI